MHANINTKENHKNINVKVSPLLEEILQDPRGTAKTDSILKLIDRISQWTNGAKQEFL